MKLLDLFCGAGGCTKGYQLAGFTVTGVDINPQPRYCGEEFHQGDALEFLRDHGHEFDAIHASPPCQAHSAMTKGRWQDRVSTHPQLIEPVRELLFAIGRPYVIENVVGAPLLNPIMLCGTMFGLSNGQGNQLLRHRLFELSFENGMIPPCAHNNLSCIGVYGGGQNPKRRKAVGVYGGSGGTSTRDGELFGVEDRRLAMGIEWMTGKELNQAIPPAYTKFIGDQLMAHLAERRAA